MIAIRRQFELEGRLQGVGFRPLVYRLANHLGLTGSVRNTGQGVWLELQGLASTVEKFEQQLKSELPPAASIRRLTKRELSLIDETSFQIVTSESVPLEDGKKNLVSAEILPDLAMCSACSSELGDEANRRYRYPFIQCTDCGPRYSILLKLPFDRSNTTMAGFQMCEDCLGEYKDPMNRRFHAQAICCADCGPSLCLKDDSGKMLSNHDTALKQTAEKIRQGAVVAVLGVGGFHLICDARSDAAVMRLRQNKKRDAKPFALMAPSLKHARELGEISPNEERILLSQGAPIVLLKRTAHAERIISSAVAPGIGTLGVMLPYTPFYRLLMDELGSTVVATSGNRSEEPICHEEKEAFSRLKGMADFFLVHNRPIVSRVDDSVVREIAGTEVVFRAGRGYAPLVLGLALEGESDSPQVLALGSHQKNTLSFSKGGRVVLMPHVGNLDSLEAVTDYEHSLAQLVEIQDLSKSELACDLHPDYHSTRVAKSRSPHAISVQHHEAHLLSCVAEHGIRGPIFGVAWDGTGYGTDGTLWGGEFFKGSEKGFSRTGHLRPFKLPGGEAAIKEPRRTAFGLLFEMHPEMNPQNCTQFTGNLDLSEIEARTWLTLMNQGLNSPLTSSAGRLFDAVAALLRIRTRCDYDGQAAVELEFAATQYSDPETYPIQIISGAFNILNWEPWIRGILYDQDQHVNPACIAAKFHLTLAHSVVAMAKRADIEQVVLSGGCFQNKLLSEWTLSALRKEGFSPYWNQKVPPNDGGLSIGQVLGGCNVLIHSR